MKIREARPEDVDGLFDLMVGLARFENYIDDFVVTRDDVLQFGFGPDALFTAFVADQGGELVGIAVTYEVPWTYTLKPKLVLKELFVAKTARGRGAGRALMHAVADQAKEMGADHIAWTVMTGNNAAEIFYRMLGGQADTKWNNWTLAVSS